MGGSGKIYSTKRGIVCEKWSTPKKTTMSDISQIDGRWYPRKVNFKDVLKSGNGTDFIIKEIQFNPTIPPYIFTKASLKNNQEI